MQHFTSFFLKFKSNLLVKKSLRPVECCFLHANLGFNFTCTSCIICYRATQVVKIFHILQFFLIYNYLYWRWFPLYSNYLNFFHIYFYPIASSSFN